MKKLLTVVGVLAAALTATAQAPKFDAFDARLTAAERQIAELKKDVADLKAARVLPPAKVGAADPDCPDGLCPLDPPKVYDCPCPKVMQNLPGGKSVYVAPLTVTRSSDCPTCPKTQARAASSWSYNVAPARGFSGHTHTCSQGHTWDHTMDGGSHNCPSCGEHVTVQTGSSGGYSSGRFGGGFFSSNGQSTGPVRGVLKAVFGGRRR